MQKIKIVAICLVICAILGATFIAIYRVPSASGTMVVVLNTNNLPSVPNSVDVLEIKTDDITRERALSVADEFGVNGGNLENLENVDNVWKVWEGSNEVWLYESGGIKYYTSEMLGGMYLRDELPSDSACKAVADSFLGNIKRDGLLDNTINISFKDVVCDGKSIAYRDGTRENYVTNVHVNYSLSFNGIKLWGPGAGLRVYVGEEGAVTGYIGSSWEVSELKTTSTLKIEDAIEIFKNRDYAASKAVINSVELVYYAPPYDIKNDLVPVYKFEGEFTSNDGFTTAFSELVPAIPQSEIEIGWVVNVA